MLQDGPLCLEAAARLLDRVHRGDTVVLSTGFPMAPWSFTASIPDRFGDAALTKLETRWFDYQEVVLIDGEWKIINVLWTGKDGGPIAVEDWFYLRDSSEPQL